MIDPDELARRLRAFRKTGHDGGVIRCGEDAVDISFATMSIRTLDTESCWTWFRRPAAPHPPVKYPGQLRTLTIDEIEIETLDPALLRAWIDDAVIDAMRIPESIGAYKIEDDRVSLAEVPFSAQAQAGSVIALAAIATRPARLRRQVDAAVSHLDTRTFGTTWALANQFSVAIRAHTVDVTLDWIRRLPGDGFFDGRLRTRLRVALDAPALDLPALLAKHPARVAALDDATILRDGVGVAVLRDGLVLDRTALDTALDLLVALALDVRGASDAGPYR